MPATSETLAPYVEQLLDNEDVKTNVRRAVSRAEQAYARARSRKDTKQALKDQAVQQRVRQSVTAARDAIVAIRRGPEVERAKARRRRRRNRVLGLALVAGGGFALIKLSAPPDKEKADV